MNKPPESAEGLLRKSAADLEGADVLFAHHLFDLACFHAQQCAEKAVKALLADTQKAYPFTHDLAELCHEAGSTIPQLADLKAPLAALTPFAVLIRYGEEINVAQTDAQQALDTARQVLALITFHIRHKNDL